MEPSQRTRHSSPSPSLIYVPASSVDEFNDNMQHNVLEKHKEAQLAKYKQPIVNINNKVPHTQTN